MKTLKFRVIKVRGVKCVKELVNVTKSMKTSRIDEMQSSRVNDGEKLEKN